MPPLRRWIQFLTSAGVCIGLGVLISQYAPPSDQQFLNSLSPELRAKYEKELPYRQAMDEIVKKKIQENVNNPAWLNGMGAMKKQDVEAAEEARRLVDNDLKAKVLEEAKAKNAELQKLEKARK